VKKSGSSRGLRGGSFNNNENNLRASNRNNNDPTNENNNIGFRVARPLKKGHAFPTVRSWRCENVAMQCRVQGPAGCREPLWKRTRVK
jgi:hypothetical protein